jgi:hypothetical protein
MGSDEVLMELGFVRAKSTVEINELRTGILSKG